MKKVLILMIAMIATGVCSAAAVKADFLEISQAELRDRIAAFWYGQLVDNFMGYSFEGQHKDTPVPVLADRYYDYRDADEVKIVGKDIRGAIRHVTGYYGGAVSDDDTDIAWGVKTHPGINP